MARSTDGGANGLWHPTLAEARKRYRILPAPYSSVGIGQSDVLQQYVTPIKQLERRDKFKRYESYIAYGNQLHEKFEDDAILAVTTINRIIRRRINVQKTEPFARTVYLLHLLLQYSGQDGAAMPLIDIKLPFYQRLEAEILMEAPRLMRTDFDAGGVA